MPIIEVNEQLAAPVDEVWALIRDVESYPRFMEPVRSITVLECGPDSRLVAWEAQLKGSVLRWTEHEQLDPGRYRVDYHQIDGDLEEFTGFWALTPVSERVTDARLVVRFEIGIPMLRDMLNPVAENAIRDNARRMLRSLVSDFAREAGP